MWIVMILGVIALSLMPRPPIPDLLAIGKFDHGFAYFCLAAMAVQLYAQRNAWLLAAAGLIALGIALELAQGYLTDYRDMSVYDGMIDTVGVAIGLATGWTPFTNVLQRIDVRMR
jgi:VanZ family protein